jgi:N-acetylneuraminate synthase
MSDIFIIAEVGSNWTSLDECLYSIRVAKVCGADAVKFQLFDKHSLYGFWGVIDHYGNLERLTGQLDPEWLPRLKAQADLVGIEFMCSAFSPEFYDIVNPYVKRHKIASSEMNHVGILNKVRTFDKPVILSCGASVESEIRQSLDILGPWLGEHFLKKETEVTLLYCEGAYPAKYTYLPNIGLMRQTFGLPVGISDHSIDVFTTPLGAQAQGATVLEKHVSFIEGKTPDSGHSLNQNQFKAMVDALRGNIKPFLGPSPDEADMIKKHRRRLIAVKDIRPGEKLVEGVNFGVYRSLSEETHAWSPFRMDSVRDKEALREIRAGEGIGPGDV